MFRLFVLLLALCSSGCRFIDDTLEGGLNPSLTDGRLDLSLEKLKILNISSTEVTFSYKFSGDYNNNSEVYVYFCSVMKQSGCDPASGNRFRLEKSGVEIVKTIQISDTEVSPGDVLKYGVQVIDPDGVSGDGGSENDFILIPRPIIAREGILQFGAAGNPALGPSGNEDIKRILVAPDGSIFLGGDVEGSFGDFASGGEDVIVIKLTPQGQLDQNFGKGGVFQLGKVNIFDASANDRITDMIFDTNGDLIVSGRTSASLGGPWGGWQDSFFFRLNSASGKLIKSFGNGDGQDGDGILHYSLDLIAGSNWDEDEVSCLALDSKNRIYAAGNTYSSFGGPLNVFQRDVWVTRINLDSGTLDTTFGSGDGLDSDGILQINANFTLDGTGEDYVNECIIDENDNFFMTGSTLSDLGGTRSGSYETYVLKLLGSTGLPDPAFGSGDGQDNDGILMLNNLFATDSSNADYPNDIISDGVGHLFISISSSSALGGTSGGLRDFVVAKIDSATGTLVSAFGGADGTASDGILQVNDNLAIDSSQNDYSSGLFLDTDGLYLVGYTYGSLGGSLTGSFNTVVMKLDPVTGNLMTSFGNGDGNNGDGVLQLNSNNVSTGTSSGWTRPAQVLRDGVLYLAGDTGLALGGPLAGERDAMVIAIDTALGSLSDQFGSGDGIDNDGILQINFPDPPTKNTLGYDLSQSIVYDGLGNVYLGGYTTGSFGNEKSDDSRDILILKINLATGKIDDEFGDADGNPNDGIIQIDGPEGDQNEQVYAMALDGAGNLYVAGETSSSLGAVNSGGRDGFIMKLDTTDGNFDPDFGDGDGQDNDGIKLIVSSGSISASGTDSIYDMTLAGSSIYVTGGTSGDLGGVNGGYFDAFVAKLDNIHGNLDSSFGNGDGSSNDGIVQFNASNTSDPSLNESGSRILHDGLGNLFLGMQTQSDLSGTTGLNYDLVVIKMNETTGTLDTGFGDGDGTDDDGILQFNNSKSPSSNSIESFGDMILDGLGNLFVLGNSRGDFGGVSAGSDDCIILKVDTSDGNFISTFGDGDGTDNDGITQVNGTYYGQSPSNRDECESIALGNDGSLYIAGTTYSSIGGPIASQTSADIFVLKANPNSGLLDLSFGNGDGIDGDGIAIMNSTSTNGAPTGYDEPTGIIFDSAEGLIITGNTQSSLGEINGGFTDLFLMLLDPTSGRIR